MKEHKTQNLTGIHTDDVQGELHNQMDQNLVCVQKAKLVRVFSQKEFGGWFIVPQ